MPGLISLLVLFGKGKSCQAGFGQRQQCDMNIEKITISAKLEGRRTVNKFGLFKKCVKSSYSDTRFGRFPLYGLVLNISTVLKK